MLCLTVFMNKVLGILERVLLFFDTFLPRHFQIIRVTQVTNCNDLRVIYHYIVLYTFTVVGEKQNAMLFDT